jgi:hypothetical protein
MDRKTRCKKYLAAEVVAKGHEAVARHFDPQWIAL